jgi:hypothetical protein
MVSGVDPRFPVRWDDSIGSRDERNHNAVREG